MNKETIQVLLERPIAFHPIFAHMAGSANAGLFYSQLFYWSGKEADQNGWIYKTQAEWQQETALTRREQDTARKRLKQLQVLEEKLDGNPAKLHYRIVWPVLLEKLEEAVQSSDAQKRQTSLADSHIPCTKTPNKMHKNAKLSLTENTAESTSEKASSSSPFSNSRTSYLNKSKALEAHSNALKSQLSEETEKARALIQEMADEDPNFHGFLFCTKTLRSEFPQVARRLRKTLNSYNSKASEAMGTLIENGFDIGAYTRWFFQEKSSKIKGFNWGIFAADTFVLEYANEHHAGDEERSAKENGRTASMLERARKAKNRNR